MVSAELRNLFTIVFNLLLIHRLNRVTLDLPGRPCQDILLAPELELHTSRIIANTHNTVCIYFSRVGFQKHIKVGMKPRVQKNEAIALW